MMTFLVQKVAESLLQTQTCPSLQGKQCCRHKWCPKQKEIIFIRNIFYVATMFPMLGKEGNICVPSNVSGTLCPHLPGHLVSRYAVLYARVTIVIYRFSQA